MIEQTTVNNKWFPSETKDYFGLQTNEKCLHFHHWSRISHLTHYSRLDKISNWNKMSTHGIIRRCSRADLCGKYKETNEIRISRKWTNAEKRRKIKKKLAEKLPKNKIYQTTYDCQLCGYCLLACTNKIFVYISNGQL